MNWRNAANGGCNSVLVGTGDISHEELCAAGEALAEDVSYNNI